MNVYGSIKSLRNRGTKKKNGGEDEEVSACVEVKKDSIKRKFYRWFPDLEERFRRNKAGQYQPIHGHEYEIQYRKQMREKSTELVARKRASTNKRNNNQGSGRPIVEEDTDLSLPRADKPVPVLNSSSSSSRGPVAPPTRMVTFNDQDIISSFVSEDEDESSTIDEFFHASGAIFDEVNEEFYGEESSSGESNNSVVEESLDAISSSSSSLEDDLELWGDGLMGISIEEGQVGSRNY